MSKNWRKNALSAFIHLTTHKVSYIFPYNYYKQCVIFPHHPHFPQLIVWGEHGFGGYGGFFSHKLAQIIFVVESV
mgnify:CR=1 FL=1